MEGPATLDGIDGFGLMRISQTGALKDSHGHFRAKDADGHSGLHDSFDASEHSVYEGPIQGLDGRVRRMRVKAIITRISWEAGSTVTLQGSGPAELVE